MPLKTNVGVSRKVADNNYGSRGASVNLELELDSTLIQDPERFHDRIRQVFRLAQQAIDEELNRQQGNNTAGHATNGTTNGQPAQSGNGHAATNGNATNGNGRNGHAASTASEKQLAYARQLAKGIQGLGIRRLESLAEKMLGKQIVALTTLDASGLIDTLKSIKAGEIDIKAVLEPAA
jgi:hypothetical protein